MIINLFGKQMTINNKKWNLIKLTQQNIRLGKQTTNNERESYDNLRQCENIISKG